MERTYIYYNTVDWEAIRKIQERFGFPRCVNVNGMTCEPVEIRDEDRELLEETQRRGWIQIRRINE